MEDAWFTAADGTKIHGWYVPHEKPRAVVLFCHGNAGNITHRAEILRELHDRVGAAVLVFDYRGYGKSEGKPDEPGVLGRRPGGPHLACEKGRRGGESDRAHGRVAGRGRGGRSGRRRRPGP